MSSQNKALAVIAALSQLLFFTPSSFAADDLTLERTVLIMRHGIRAPLKTQITPDGVASDPWPTWTTAIGDLTPRGAEAITLLGQYDRASWIDRGLLKTGCPAPGLVSVQSNAEERTIKTGHAWIKGAFPGCDVKNVHQAIGTIDPRFDPFEAKTDIDGAKGVEAGLVSTGGLDKVRDAYRKELTCLGEVLGCCSVQVCKSAHLPEGCTLADLPGEFSVGHVGDRPRVKGVFDYPSTASQTLMLQYLDNMPMHDVGWGRATPADLGMMIGLHTMKADLYQRPFYIAQYGASLLMWDMLAALENERAPVITVFVGHDSNINDLSGLLGFEFTPAGFAKNVPIPGGAWGLELLRNKKGETFVRAFYRGQTPAQMRNLEPLSTANRPYREVVAIKDCTTDENAPMCSLNTFAALVRSKILPKDAVIRPH
jgi:4-phytase/acid phosphatase